MTRRLQEAVIEAPTLISRIGAQGLSRLAVSAAILAGFARHVAATDVKVRDVERLPVPPHADD